MSQITIDQSLRLAIEHHRAGRLSEAEVLYRQVLAAHPNQPDALHLLGLIASRAGRLDPAIDLIRKAVAVAPGNAEYHTDLADALQRRGDIDQAIAAYQAGLAINPNHVVAQNNLGLAWLAKGQFDLAIACLMRVVVLSPDFDQAHFNLGIAMKEKGELDQAIACFQRAVAIRPDYPEAYNDLGVLMKEKGQLDQAIACFQRAVKSRPEFVAAYYNLGNVWKEKGHLDPAIECFRRALVLDPEHADAHCNLGIALHDKGQLDPAIACYQRLLALKPDYAAAHANLGMSWIEKGLLDQAIASYQRAIVLDGNDAGYHTGLGNAWKDAGDLDKALACYRRAMELDPDSLTAHGNLLYALPFHPDSDRATLLAEFQRWNRQHAAPLRRYIQPHSNDRKSDRRLRVGYVSPDFCRHPVGRFVSPLLASHDHFTHEIFCYSGVLKPDPLTATIKSHADVWRNIVGLSDEQAVEMIRQDRIDILVDLSMHTANNRLLIFARKPAPVQVTYLACAGGTGLDSIDYRLTDRFLDPDDTNDCYYMEKLIRLPQTYWCYEQSIATAAPNELPLVTTGTVTFGCLNNFSKLSPGALETWAVLLNTLANSRLLVHMKSGSHRDRLIQFMSERGIAGDRLDIVGLVPSEEYFKTYHRIDIALDPFPHAGGTTTCDALWMGVPVVTLAGNLIATRAGVSILSNVGLPELIAQTPEQYIQIAMDLAADKPRLIDLRATLRRRMQQSPLMDAERFARDVEAAYRTMWRTWCEKSG
jgi:protein O-GlcNAc transferase